MINIFDLSASMAGTMMPTEKGHRDGSLLHRGWSDANKVPDIVEPPLEDKPVTHESRSSSCKKYNGTPMKKLIEQEMSTEIDARRKPPSIVAKLMGLEALPAQQQSAPISQRTMPPGKLNRSLTGSETIQDHQHHGKLSLEKMARHDIQPFQYHVSDNKGYQDVYEVSQQPSRSGHFKDEPFLRGRYRENPIDKRMVLVRQKFIEAKRLATNQRLLQSKEFQDALEFLSSNRDLFLKFLEEPNSLFSKYLDEVQTSPLPTQTRRITVLKPSRSLDIGFERRMKSCVPVLETNSFDGSMTGGGSTFLRQKTESVPQPTRIVVLKPSPNKLCNTNAFVASPTMSLRSPQRDDSFEDFGTDVARGSRGVAKEIARQMRESFSSRRDETLLSSVLSNGYTGDESSIYRSDDENMEDECGKFSDSDIGTPTCRHSWDCINRVDSPYSLSPISGVSYSPETLVIREARKRLSERWVMLTSNETSHKQQEVRRSTSTLGEMLALTESKKEEEEVSTLISSFRGGSCGGDQDLNAAFSCMSGNKNSDATGGGETMPSNLQRSKSVPASHSMYDTVKLELDASLHTAKSAAPLCDKKKSGKSSFKGKLSSLLFSRSKKLSSEKPLPSSKGDSPVGIQSSNDEHDASVRNITRCSSHDLHVLPGVVPFKTTDQDGRRAETPIKVSTTVEKPKTLENVGEHLGQPSPVSVLESPFGDDVNLGASQPCQSSLADSHRAISRSPPIESVARSLSFDGAHAEKKTTFTTSDHSADFLRADIEECEQTTFVQMLLSSSGLSNEMPRAVFARWHSLESPLNPALLDKFMERKEEAARCRERRSNQRLLFDCVNAVLFEISCNKEIDRRIYWTCCLGLPDGILSSDSVTEEVLKRLKEWFSSIDKMVLRCRENGTQQLVDYIVRKELNGNRWAEMAGSEIGELGREIERRVLEELVGEALADFVSSCTG